ncbi:MAG: thiamine-phosphate kinase [Candidatus Omnitrophica bacterium]|nr:thiamine-phosphate kinase [Candidatus Omnitrophota bacterium]
MLISKLGEFGLIERLKKKIRVDSSVMKGIGDDCAVLEFDRKNYLLATCDMLIEGVDFTHRTDPYLIGRKALAVSLSDIAACAGRARYCLVSLGLAANTPVSYVDRLTRGILDLAKRFRVNVVGGDLSRAEQLTLDVSVLGLVEKNNLTLRRGAKKGDIIFVTGELGGSIRGKHLKFTPRLKEARFLVEHFKPQAMIDISDGLAQDLGHILKEGNSGAFIYEALIPLSGDARNLKDALYGGEDFELLFTLPLKSAKRLLRTDHRFKPIGEITDKKHGLTLVNKAGRLSRIPMKGFRHF